ncbi:borealin [Daktulosphaira vitifoliae]|uniref:borealin n=1 Tax=Daktulosphaira vitifoliae TaxID=58002 RepID=UPI0021A9A812|nr:borealin [Daktulosphaira vitifoliae]XP_050521157.1 borealin [Daktulosphaira vitifoliae]XP_050521159.1 borealin [Daktulosphaira vitifoliae]
MPRTKRRTVKRTSSDVNMTVNMTVGNQPKNVKELLDEFDFEKKNIEDSFYNAYDNCRNQIESSFLLLQMNLSGKLELKLHDYLAECNNVESSKNILKGSERSTRPTTKSAASNGTSKTKNASASRLKQTAVNGTVTKTRTTRGEERPPLSEKNNESRYKTPVNRPPIPTSATVTPKVNMNEPISVMRRPNQGEVALSMTGSPLMVSSVSRDDMATVSVPLANGNVLSILPRTGAACMDISFDEQTKKELLLLKGNIEGLLKIKGGL